MSLVGLVKNPFGSDTQTKTSVPELTGSKSNFFLKVSSEVGEMHLRTHPGKETQECRTRWSKLPLPTKTPPQTPALVRTPGSGALRITSGGLGTAQPVWEIAVGCWSVKMKEDIARSLRLIIDDVNRRMAVHARRLTRSWAATVVEVRGRGISIVDARLIRRFSCAGHFS